MKTDNRPEEILNRLIASTRSPRGRFSAAESYPKLVARLHAYHRQRTLVRFCSAAAAVVILCLSAWAAYLYIDSATIQTVSTLAETRSFILPDGTTVTLNHYSSLSYPKKFRKTNREVKLSGEGFFEVTHDETHPFIVQTPEIDIQVLGTQFNVDAYDSNPEIRTTLFSGSVAVSDKQHTQRLILRPSEMARYHKSERKLSSEKPENIALETAWKNGEFIFDQLPLKEIVRELSNAFGTTIRIIDPKLENYRISAHFRNNENLEQILSILQDAGYFDYSSGNQQIIITSKPDLQ